MKKVLGYVISEKNKFNDWAYNEASIYYMAKKIGVFDSITGELKYIYYNPLNSKYAYRNNLIDLFRGLEVEKI